MYNCPVALSDFRHSRFLELSVKTADEGSFHPLSPG